MNPPAHSSQKEQINRAIHLLKLSRLAIGLTGAGVSTPSGIPDFRSPESGVWENVDPFEVASITAFRRHPEKFYNWVYPLAHASLNAAPNPAHMALALLEQHGPLKALITQNIDMLHTGAGSQTIYEIHGHLRQATCLSCQATFDGRQTLAQFLATNQVPRCPHCEGIIKPDVILFGEILPYDILLKAQAAVESCDLLLVAGSSLEVSPASDLPLIAKRNGARVIIVNWGETYFDAYADVVIRADVAEALPILAQAFLPK